MYVIKNLNNQKRQIIILLFVIVTVGIYANCGKKKTTDEEFIQGLLKTWKVGTVSYLSKSVTDEFKQYQITFMSDGTEKNFVWIDRHGKRHTGVWDISTDRTVITLNVDGGNTVVFDGVSLIEQLAYFVEEKVNNETRKLSFVLVPV